jgi:hypothetical protein
VPSSVLSSLAALACAALMSALTACGPLAQGAGEVVGAADGPDDDSGDGPIDEHVDELALLEAIGELDDDSAAEFVLPDLMREAAAFRSNPVDVNTATLAELIRVPGLDPGSAACVLSRRSQTGPVCALDDLVLIGCLTAERLRRVRPYLTVGTPCGTPGRSPGSAAAPGLPATRPAAAADRGTAGTPGYEVRTRVSADGDSDDSWSQDGLGPLGLFCRLRVSYGDRYSLSLAFEKDRGEADILDHTAIGASWKTDDLELGVGDITGRWGQGLVMGHGGFPTTRSYPRVRDGLRRYDGAGEASARRGVFADATRGRLRVQALVARTKLDAGIDERGRVAAIRTSGYHRTDLEQQGAEALAELLLGARVTVRCAQEARLSVSALNARYEPRLALGDCERRRFGFRGEELVLLGADIALRTEGLFAGCELACRPGGGTAAVAGLRVSRGGARARAGTGFLSRDYWSPLGRGLPGSSGGTNGVVGWVGLGYRPDARWRLEAEVRVTGRPWRSYRLELPDESTSVMLVAESDLGSLGRFRMEHVRKLSACETGGSNATSDRRTSRWRLSVHTSGSPSLSLAVRRATKAVDGLEEGSVLTIGSSASGEALPGLLLSAGVTAVTSEGSPPALVQHEPGLPGAFCLHSLNASGVRWYIRLRSGFWDGAVLTLVMSAGPGPGHSGLGVSVEAEG